MRVVQVLIACALVSLVAACDEPVETTGTPPASQSDRIELARKYAPLVILGKDEKYEPIDATTFIANADLRWNRDGGCKDTDVDENPTPRHLATPGRYHQRPSTKDLPTCDQSGREYDTTEPTRPFDNAELGAEGYFLELKNEDTRTGGSTKAPAYVQYVDGTDAHAGKTGYVYWFFYPWNHWTSPGGVGGNHEGDWERVTVVADKATGPEAVVYTYHGHECRRNLSEVDVTDGRLTVYSAVGTHASYPVGDARYRNKDLPPGLKDWDKLADGTSKSGERWQIWDTLREAEREPWWGYAGGWGEVGGNAAVNLADKAAPIESQKRQTGPAGPSKHKNEQIRAEAFTGQPCQAPEPGSPSTSESAAPGPVAKTKEGAIQRYERLLHAVGDQDTPTVCEITAPALKTVPMPCPEAIKMMYGMIPAAKRQALRTVTIDPAKVRAKGPGEFVIPASAVRGSVTFAERELGTQTMTYVDGDWFVTDN